MSPAPLPKVGRAGRTDTMRALRPFAFLVLALTLAVSSITAAMAHGQVRVGTELVICTGAGLQTIVLDADGNPAGPPHVCPDCTQAFVLALNAAPVFPARPATRVERVARADGPAPHTRTRDIPRARGPPVLS